MMENRLCMPNEEILKREIMEEAHCPTYSMHPSNTKMYRILRESYWLQSLKKEIADFMAKCLVCQQIKAKHQCPSGTLQTLLIPE